MTNDKSGVWEIGENSDANAMADENPVNDHPVRFFFKGQLLHFLLLLALLGCVSALVHWKPIRENHLLGLTTWTWFIIGLTIPVVHQVYVWLIWRSELCFGTVTKRFGSVGFWIYEAVFIVLLLSRPLSMTILTIADHDSVPMSIGVRITLSVLLALPAIYAFYSVARYFGIVRASGIDHFDPSYRDLPLVRKGIFRFTGNAMYSFAFLLVWVIAVAGASWAAIVVALFSHVYIWVHYFCTERPDMRVIYGS